MADPNKAFFPLDLWLTGCGASRSAHPDQQILQEAGGDVGRIAMRGMSVLHAVVNVYRRI